MVEAVRRGNLQVSEGFKHFMFENARHGGCVPAYCHVVVNMRPCVGCISSIVASSKTHPDTCTPVR